MTCINPTKSIWMSSKIKISCFLVFNKKWTYLLIKKNIKSYLNSVWYRKLQKNKLALATAEHPNTSFNKEQTNWGKPYNVFL